MPGAKFNVICRSGNGRPLIARRCLLLMLVTTPLGIVNRCCSGFPVSGGIWMSV